MNPFRPSPLALVAVIAAALSGSCGPLGLEGSSCTKGPCAAGLTCVEEVCTVVEPPPPPPAPCTEDEDCALDGSADGRTCTEGVCGYASCAFDLQCGSRICEDGSCADRELCVNDESCGEGRVCTDEVCRKACVADDECPSLGALALATCVEGECVQRCLGDFMCLQAICVENLCAAPECAEDADCDGPGSYACETGRCAQFTPCKVEDDCFDPNFLCNEIGRCEERPACTGDSECGSGLCLDDHCRDTPSCDAADPCADDLHECIAGRCVEVLECRGDADCAPAERCDAARCSEAQASVDPTILVVRTPHGPCTSDGGGACAVACLAGSQVTLPTQGYDSDGVPVTTSVTTLITSGGPDVLTTDGRVALPCPSGALALTVQAGAVAVEVQLRSLPVPEAGDLLVVVSDARGAPVAGASVFVDDALSGATDGNGALSIPSFAGGTIGARSAGSGVVVLDATPGTLFLTLADAALGQAAGFRARINGTGDELGAVGVGLALPSTRTALAVTPVALFGEVFSGTVELPLLGAVPVALPAATTLDATLLIVGPQEIKPLAFATAVAGPGALLALEGRFEQQLLLNIALAADPIETSLDIAALAEGMDARVAGAGRLEDLAFVIDGDLADGIEDVDGDGDVGELVPDYGSFSEIEVQPDAAPLERVGVVVSPPPVDANARALAVCGLELPHGFLPLGVGVAFGSSTGEQVKVKSAPSTTPSAPRACVVQAVFAAGDASASAAVVRGNAFGPLLDAGALLAPPAGSFLLEGVPTPDRSSIVVPDVPGANALAVTVFDGDVTWEVLGSARGSLALPSYLVPLALGGTTAFRLDDDIVVVLSSPLGTLDTVAAALAAAP